MSHVVVTETLAESSAAEEALNEALTDLAFAPSAPITALPPKWAVGSTYAKGALVTEGTQVYRSQEAANKGNEPKADTDFAHWAPVGTAFVPLQNPALGFPTAVRTEPGFNKPPARSDAAAPAAETINPGDEIGLGV